MQFTNEVKISLKREYALCSNAIAFYKKTLKKFDTGQIGDDADYFDWYAFAKLLAQWQKTQSAIRSVVR